MYSIVQDTTNKLTVVVTDDLERGEAIVVDIELHEDIGKDCLVHSETVSASVTCTGKATFELVHECGNTNVFHSSGGEYYLKLFNSLGTLVGIHWIKLNTSNE